MIQISFLVLGPNINKTCVKISKFTDLFWLLEKWNTCDIPLNVATEPCTEICSDKTKIKEDLKEPIPGLKSDG